MSPMFLRSIIGCVRLRCMEINRDDLAVDTLLMGHRATSLLWTPSEWHLPQSFEEPLRRFSISLPSLRAMHSLLFQETFSLMCMESLDLYIAFPSLVSCDELKLFAVELSRSCPRLSLFSLTMVSGIQSSSDLLRVQVLDFETIRPFLAISSMESFRIAHTYPLLISDSDLQLLSRAWPLLRSLYLNPNPAVLVESMLSFACVPFLVRDCPRLEAVSLYVNGQRLPRVWERPEGIGGLKKMCLGMSVFPLDDGPDTWWGMAEYLSLVLPVGCMLSTGFTVEDLDINTYMTHSPSLNRFIIASRWQLFNCQKGWNSVFALVGTLRRHRASFSPQYFSTTAS